MKYSYLLSLIMYSSWLMASVSPVASGSKHFQTDYAAQIDTTKIPVFFETFPKFKPYEAQVKLLYRKYSNHTWYDQKGLIEFTFVLYKQVQQMREEGVPVTIPYEMEFTRIFEKQTSKIPNQETELLISCMYFFYTSKVFNGFTVGKSEETGWFLPRESANTADVDSLMQEIAFKKEIKHGYFSQYYPLRQALKKYLEIEKNGGWKLVQLEKGIKSLQPSDSSLTVQQIRTRLFVEGYINQDSGSFLFDQTVSDGITAYGTAQNHDFNAKITGRLIEMLNVPVESRIKTISVNMERCRWINPKINNTQEYIAVNIPSFRLLYFREGKPYLTSKVVVGKEFHKTIVFSGSLSYISFSPYWNVPSSILRKEILPKVKKNPNYLKNQNMEWHNGQVRQKPGGSNALGLVKFMFPNSHNIYLHDSPSKSFFSKDKRAFSHGCVRVEKARDLAVAIMEKEANWNSSKVDAAMHLGKENTYVLENKIPVYIAYFTAWADGSGNIAFYDDLYNRDNALAKVLFEN
ncbi:L,D-transpeptidase [Flavobacterium circumlabens]|uniref:L,D-transpeptidase n=1 Tax=Flavobacterium circumlabens TaxID=2133765 RepID=A0A4Y7UEC8_9FLAO|nr:L,D-transpeptidase family protein [Flavobacterium circumlabens]TCN58890.1 L,D-transpeptidase-like protein [Flavobacterium circumlabens]TEB44298.1 L,D-transpeptidase [Flavobacterium circumlabens]